MNICELSATLTTTNLVKKHDVFMKLQEKGYKVEPIHNQVTNKFDENLIGIDEFLCFVLPLDNSPRIINEKLLDSVDFIIATTRIGDLINYYVIPSDDVAENSGVYPLEYSYYKDRWDLLDL